MKLSEAERIIASMSELKDIARFHLHLHRAEIEKIGWKKFESLKKRFECPKRLEKTEITETMRRFLKHLGGKAENWKNTSRRKSGELEEYINGEGQFTTISALTENVRGVFKSEYLRYVKLHSDALLSGIGCIFGFVKKRDASLRAFDVVNAPEDVKMIADNLYNAALNPARSAMRW